MLELLDVQPGHKVLDIGAGSGWASALLSHLVGSDGQVFAFEIVPEVGEFGRGNIERFGCKNVSYVIDDYAKHLGKNAPYDRVLSGAAFDKVPEDLKESLVEGGILVAPTADHDIRKIVRVSADEFEEEIFPGFVFVPITGKKG